MSYNKTTWAAGDVVTSEKLNKMEEGIHSGYDGMFIIRATIDTSADPTDGHDIILDKTSNEILEAYDNGKIPVIEAIEEIVPGVAFKLLLYLTNIAVINGNGYIAFQRTMFEPQQGGSKVTVISITIMKNQDTDTVNRETLSIYIPNETT